MSSPASYEFLNRKEWRKWLKQNHSFKKEIWTIIHKRKSSNKGLRYKEAVEEALCFGWIDSRMQSIDNEKFRLRFSPRRKTSLWSQSNKETAERMISTGKMTRAGYGAINEAKRNGKWDSAYSSKAPVTIPTDLKKALTMNELAWRNFEKFSNSVKFQYVYWVNSAKKDETKRKRIADVVTRAARKIKPS